MSDKIKISWDDLNSPEADQKIQEQQLITRSSQHYQQKIQINPANGGGPVQPSSRTSETAWYYRPLLTAALFGLLGGFTAWACSEVLDKVVPNYYGDFRQGVREYAELLEKTNNGSITESEAKYRFDKLQRKYASNPYVRINVDDSLSESQKERQRNELRESSHDYMQQVLWYAMIGMLIAAALAITEDAIGKNWHAVITKGTMGLVLGMVGGAIVGLFINKLYNAMGGGGSENHTQQVVARAVGWAILGLFLAVAPGIMLRNPKRLLIGLAGGFAGGLLGGLLFDLVANTTGSGVASRFVAICGIGVLIGLGTGLLENVAKTGWLKVVGGLIAGKQFILYRDPTVIGSSPKCEIYLFKDTQVAPQHAFIRTVGGGFEIEDGGAASGTRVNGSPIRRRRLRRNDEIQIGSTVFSFQEKTAN